MVINDEFIEEHKWIIMDILYKNFKYLINYYKDDLFQVGYIGLIRAAELYKEGKGKFSTYAYYWVYKEIRDWCMNCLDHVRLPEYIFTDKELRKENTIKVVVFSDMLDAEENTEIIDIICNTFNYDFEDREKDILFKELYGKVKVILKEEDFDFIFRRLVLGETLEKLDTTKSKEWNRVRINNLIKKLKKEIPDWESFI